MAENEITEPQTIFERAMKALMDADPTEARFEMTDRGSPRYNGVAERVRAVLTAIREPSDLWGNSLPVDYRPGSHSATAIWQLFIDAALAEGE